MKRVEFIKELSNYLANEVRPSEVHRLIEYYDEMILDLMEDGYSEEEAVSRMGDPQALAYEAAGIPSEIKVPRRFSPLVIILLILGFPLWGSLAFAGFMILLSFYIVIWCIPFTGACLAGGFLFGGLVATLTSPLAMMTSLFYGITQLGVGMLIFGLGLLALWATYKCSAGFINMHRWLTRKIRQSIFQRKVVNV
ncbi:hypothetical protein NRIC_28070 [Enterococcus florum]|uniref:DUF1700 domain-containing protein n=1 Tax=Enterococcus florum TaxID=2480627 RepID=A0A4P5PB44_9ENTE|nr:DUF1700 domain-containing protein [Enterococcus florum]GCF94916.1 hypothetical protein NRIC_28070 [Enterococcus florum]